MGRGCGRWVRRTTQGGDGGAGEPNVPLAYRMVVVAHRLTTVGGGGRVDHPGGVGGGCAGPPREGMGVPENLMYHLPTGPPREGPAARTPRVAVTGRFDE